MSLTTLLEQIRTLESEPARTQVFEAVYDELRRMARRMMKDEGADHTLRPTALVHEVCLKLIEQDGLTWESRAHFFGIAAHAMRRILVDHARQRGAHKRGGGMTRVTFTEDLIPDGQGSAEILALNEALEGLGRLDPRAAKVAELRLFAGLSAREIAVLLQVSRRTVDADWTMARAWLARELLGAGV